MRKNTNFLLTIAISLIIFGCESDNAVNQPPNSFSLLTINNDANDINLTPTLTWNAATDPENDPVTYDLILDNNENPNTIITTNIEETEFKLNSPLQNSENYYWKIIAKDNNGNSTESNVFSFTTIDNQPPNSFSLLTVNNGAINVDVSPTLTWSLSTDPENDPVTYDIVLDNDTSPSIVIATSINETEFKLNSLLQYSNDYYWKVIAKDNNGNSTESNVFSFTTIDNKPPSSFSLLTVNNGATDVDVSPTLTWSVATDPENDPVTYDIVLDNDTNPSVVIATNINETEFTFDIPIQYSEDFYWKVIAKDNNGNSTESDVFSFTTIDFFSQAINNAGFNGRLDHETVVFDNKIWVIGGSDENYNQRSDVWSSSDGIVWSEVTSNASFSNRASHSAITFNDKIWVIGGYSGGNKNDVWSSTDGANWTQMTSNASFSPRYAHTCVVFDNKIWVIGGEVGSLDVLSDIWNSTDGINWTQVSANGAPEKGRHTAVVYNDKIWLIGGLGQDGIKNDVWNSTDGINWTEVTSNAPFPKKYYHTSVVFDNKLWVIGGIDGNNDMYNDVWNSSDGINWREITSDAAFSKRDLHTSVVYNNNIWVIAGRDSNARKNDVWAIK